jgi:hypothetical protein
MSKQIHPLKMTNKDRLFIGVMPCGISYADRAREEDGDYKKVGFLNFADLSFTAAKGANKQLLEMARLDAAKIQARKGESFQSTTVGQFVILGHDLPTD